MRARGNWSPLAVLLALALASGVVSAQAPAPGGPYVDEIFFTIITEPDAQLIALQRGDIDIYPGLVRPADIERLQADPNVELTFDLGFHMFYLAFNMRREPLDDRVLRRAIAHVVDREEIIRQLFQGYVLPLASFVPSSSPFHDPDVPVAEYDPDLARRLLDEAGYTLDPATGIRTDPGTGQPLREILLLTPTYEVAPTSAELGRIVAEAAQGIGIPLRNEPLDFNVILGRLDVFDFDSFVLAWGLSRFPTFLFDFFHSSQDVEGGYNTPGIRDPELDRALEALRFPATLEEVYEAASVAQEILSFQQPYIPLYSRPYIDAFRIDRVSGYVPMLGFGAANYQNGWTTRSIRRVDGPGGIVRWLLPEDPKNLNPATAQSAYEWEVLGRIYENLVEVDPETLEDVPWGAQGWEAGTWEVKPGTRATRVTVRLREDRTWHDGTPFTAHDMKFSLDFYRENEVPRYLPFVQDINRVEVVDDYTYTVYFNTLSYWHVYDAMEPPPLPRHIWQDVEDWRAFQPWLEPHPTVAGLTKLIGTGPFVFSDYVPGEFVRLRRNPDYRPVR